MLELNLQQPLWAGLFHDLHGGRGSHFPRQRMALLRPGCWPVLHQHVYHHPARCPKNVYGNAGRGRASLLPSLWEPARGWCRRGSAGASPYRGRCRRIRVPDRQECRLSTGAAAVPERRAGSGTAGWRATGSEPTVRNTSRPTETGELDSVGGAGELASATASSPNKIVRPALREWNASGREPQRVGDGMLGSSRDVNQ